MGSNSGLNPCSNGIPSDAIDLAKAMAEDEVLILVLMEYPLTVNAGLFEAQIFCLNPCSNGIPSDKILSYELYRITYVLILVLMEYPLTP